MTNVILQPAGGVEARKNYVKTVANPVAFSVLASYMSSRELAVLKAATQADTICAWGMVPSRESRWRWIQPGDTVLFSGAKHFYSISTVVAKLHNQELATRLWDTDSSDRTWEWVYFFLPPAGMNIPYERFNIAVGDRPNHNHQGIDVLRGDKAEAALQAIYGQTPPISIQETTRFIDGRESLDAVYQAHIRKEQGYLRWKLLGDASSGKCGICGNDFPVRFLIASHIKKRAECTDQEKADIPSIAMPMCLMGCDALYETGYVTVGNGQVKVSNTNHAGLTELLRKLDGNPCTYWSADREKYFTWHKKNKFRG